MINSVEVVWVWPELSTPVTPEMHLNKWFWLNWFCFPFPKLNSTEWVYINYMISFFCINSWKSCRGILVKETDCWNLNLHVLIHILSYQYKLTRLSWNWSCIINDALRVGFDLIGTLAFPQTNTLCVSVNICKYVLTIHSEMMMSTFSTGRLMSSMRPLIRVILSSNWLDLLEKGKSEDLKTYQTNHN